MFSEIIVFYLTRNINKLTNNYFTTNNWDGKKYSKMVFPYRKNS